MTETKSGSREFDVVVYGATGFTGGLVAEYLLGKGELPIDRWAIAGRDPVKLAELRARLRSIDPIASDLTIVRASSDERRSLDAMCGRTKVILTTVGPYAKYGEPLVASALAQGCDYVDLTGEPVWWREMISRYHDDAQAKGVRLVPCCGFDSMPHDLGALFTANAFQEDRRAGQAVHIEAYVAAKGNFSGGTWASAIHHFANMRKISRAPRPAGETSAPKTPAPKRGLHRASVLGDKWAVPMPTIDPLVVKRSAKLGTSFGPDFRYDHYLSFKDAKMMAMTIGGVGAVVGLAQLKPTRKLLELVRSSGQGPSAAQRERSWFRVTFLGRSGDQRVVAEVRGGDPGYTETSKMISEAALCLALDDLVGEARPGAPLVHGGLLTPATACGQALIDRLVAAGIEFRVIERA